MSFSIPTQIERDIYCGKARYQTFQTGCGGQTILNVPDNSYIIIYGYDFSPAGGGIYAEEVGSPTGTPIPELLRPFMTQQISFYSGQSFYPFIHHVNVSRSGAGRATNSENQFMVDSVPISRPVYIISNKSVALTVGLIKRVEINGANLIPVTAKTPQGLTYGGSAAVPNVETLFSSNVVNPPSLIQPSLEDFEDYGLGGIPGNAQDQAFALPDQLDGLIEPSEYLQTAFGITFRELAMSNYFLNVHYALYTNQTPEQLG